MIFDGAVVKKQVASKKATAAQRPELEAMLRNWRSGETKRQGVPGISDHVG